MFVCVCVCVWGEEDVTFVTFFIIEKDQYFSHVNVNI